MAEEVKNEETVKEEPAVENKQEEATSVKKKSSSTKSKKTTQSSDSKPVVKKAKKRDVKRPVRKEVQLQKQTKGKHVYIYYAGRPIYVGIADKVSFQPGGVKVGNITHSYDKLDIVIKN